MEDWFKALHEALQEGGVVFDLQTKKFIPKKNLPPGTYPELEDNSTKGEVGA